MIQPFTKMDLSRIAHLQPDGWQDITDIFKVYIEASFCLPLKIEDNKRVAAIGSLILLKDTAWLAHIIVDPKMRRKGLGLAVTGELIDIAEKNGRNIQLLIATETGAPLYECIGFRHSCNYMFYHKTACKEVKLPSQIRPLEPADAEEILSLDQRATGEDREILLSQYGNSGWVYTGSEGKEIRGYLLSKLGEGTIVAQDVEAGTALMKLRLARLETGPVVPEGNRAANRFLLDSGFKFKSSAARMVRIGDDPLNQGMIFNRIGGHLG